MGEYLDKLRARNKEKNVSPVYRTDVDSKFKIDPKQIRDTGSSYKPMESTSTIKPKPIVSKPLRANERMLYGEIEEEDEGTKYKSYRENLKSRAIQEDTAAEEIRTLRERVRKPPTNERAAQEQTLDMDRLRRLDMHQNPQKAEVLINSEGNGLYMPELTKDLDRKLENIGNTLRSGEEKGLYNIKEGLNQGLIQNWLSNEYYRQMNNLPNQVEKIEVFMKDHPELQESYSMEGKDNYWKRATRGIIKQAPMWVAAAAHSMGKATLGAVTGVGYAALAGNASPLIIVPEEVITVPAAALFGFRYGMLIGTTEYIAAQEAGQSYVELIMSGVSPEIARPIAETVGAVNGLLESAQIGSIGKSIPGVKQFADKFKKTAISEAAKRLIKIAGSYGYEVAENVVEEVLQSGTTIAGVELGKLIHQGKTGEELARRTWKDVAGELIQTGQSALIDFSLLPSVGFAKDLTSIGIDTAKAASAKKEELKVQTRFKKAIYEDLPGSVKEFKDNINTIKSKDAVGMVILDKRLDQVLQKEGLKAEDKAQIETLKSEISAVVDNVYAEANKLAPEIKFADAKDRAGMISEILAGNVDVGLSEIILDDYKTAEKAKVVDEISTMLQDGKDTFEIGEAIEKKLPKSKRKPEVISAIIRAVEKVSSEADAEILYSKVKNIQSAMQLLPQNDVVIAENEQNVEDGVKTSQDALETIEGLDDVSTQKDAQSQGKDKTEQDKVGKEKKDKLDKAKVDKKAKENTKTDNKTELSTDEYKNSILSTDYVKNLVDNADKAKVFNEKVANTNPVYKRYKDIVTAVTNNPIFNGLTLKFIDQDNKREWKRSELDEAGYKHLKEGWYEIAGQQESHSDTSRTATFYRNSTKDTFAEELIHDLQKRIFVIDPELETMIQEWEENVHAQAISREYNIPDGYETFAQALVFSEMGYAKVNPELAELFSIPDDILDRIGELLGAELLAAISGTSKPALKKNLRMLSGKSKKVEGSYDPFDIDNYDYVEVEKKLERAHDVDFRVSKSVGKKGTKAIIELYPEFKPFYQQMANDILADLTMTIPAEWTVTQTDLATVLARNSRITTKNIAFFKDVLKASYADITASLTRMSEGKVKYALDRKIELVIDDNLTLGYENFFGDDVAANQEYLDLKYGKGETAISNQLKEVNNEQSKQSDKYIFDSRGIVDRAKELARRGRRINFSKIPTVEYRLYARYGAFRIADYTKYVAHNENITPSFRNGIMEAIEKAEAEGRHKPNTKVTFEEWFFREFEYDYSEVMFEERHSYPITTLANNENISEYEARNILIRREKDRYRYFHDKAVSFDEGSFQLKPTDDPKFVEWFKDSKVVDKNGLPLAVYHGSDYSFNEFETNTIYLSANKEFASEFGEKIKKFYVSMKNPYDFSTQEDGYYHDESGEVVMDRSEEPISIGYLEENPDVVNELIKRGYDGAMDGTDFIVAFEPTQIKSVDNAGLWDPNNADIRYQLKPVDTFYSTLQRTLDAKMPRRATAAQIMGIIKSNAVKADEIKWSGIEDFLEGKELVGKEELLQYLKDNDLKIEELTNSDMPAYSDDTRDQIEKQGQIYSDSRSKIAELAEEITGKEIPIDILFSDYDDKLYSVARSVIANYETDKSVEILQLILDAKNAKNALSQFRDEATRPTKFQGYKLPGGENYREMLFTLPLKETNADRLRKELHDAENKPWEEQGFKSISEAMDTAKEIRQKLKSMEDGAATGPKYKSPHWDEPNVLAHTRLQDYTDAKGNKVLFVEEIQSDWNLAADKEGITGTKDQDISKLASMKSESETTTSDSRKAQLKKSIDNLERRINRGKYNVPDAPLLSNYYEFVLKRLVRYATDNKYDAVALTSGEQQNDRYGLEKQVKAIGWQKFGENNYNLNVQDIDGNLIFNKTPVTITEIEETVGKEIAQRIASSDKRWEVIEGDGLKVGGENKRHFYDKMIPTFLNKYLKKWGVKVEEIELGSRETAFIPDWIEVSDLPEEFSEGYETEFISKESDADRVGIFYSPSKDSWWVYRNGEELADDVSRQSAEDTAISVAKEFMIGDENVITQSGFYLNDEMKNSAVYEGQPLYQLKEVDYDFERLSFYGTVEMSPITDPGLRAELKNMAALYMVRHNKDTVNEGLTLLYDMGTDAAKMWIMGSTPASAEMNVVAMLLIKQASDNKDNDTAIELIDAIAKKAKTNGQATQILSLFGMISPQGIVRYAKNTYQKLLTEGQINEVNEVANDLEQKLRKVNKKAAEDMDLTDAIKEIAEKTPEEMLAKRIANTLKEKTHNEYNPIKIMVDTLFKVYKETVGLETEKPIDNTLTFIAHAITEREKYKEVWQQAKAIVKELTQDDPNAEAILDEYFDLMLTQTFPERMMQKAVKTGLRELKVKIDQVVRQHYSELNKVTDTLAQKLIAEAGLSGYEAMMMQDYVEKTMATVTQEAKERILRQMSKDKSLTKRERKTLSERIIEMSNVGAFKNASYKGMIGAKLGYPAMTSELMTSLDYQAQRIQQMPEDHSKDVAVAKMLDTIAAGIPVKFWRKVNTLQTMAQLLNPKTIIRNIVGNTAFQAIDRMSRVTMIGLDVIASHFTGNRTKTFIGMTALKDREGGTLRKWGGYLGDLLMGEGFKEGWDLGLEDALNGIDTSGLTTQYDLPSTRTFRAKEGKPVSTALAMLETAMSIALRATDRSAFMASFTESLTEQMKIAKVTEATEYMVDVATVHGLYRTFQDANKVSDFFVQMKKTMNIVGTKDFGAGDLLLKYPKTPGNLLARSIDYSPLGIMSVAFKIFFDTSGKDAKGKPTAVLRSANSFKYASDNAKLDMQRAAVEGIGRAITGTALITAGYVLAKAGILLGGDEDDWDVFYMEQLAGLDQYQVNISALLRFISSGFNAEAAARQKGDTLVSYDWMQPFATLLAVGADLALRVKSFMVVVGDDKNQVIKVFDNKIDANNFVTENKSKGYKVTESTDGIGFLGSIISSIQVGSAALANQPLLQGISTLFGSKDPIAGAAEAIKSAPSGFVPTLFSQIAQLLDNEKKSTYDIKWVDEVARLIQRKVPGSSSLLEPSLDVFGEKQKYYDDDTNPIMAALYTFFSPAFVKKYNPSPEAEFILNLYDEYGDKRTVPTKVNKKVVVEGVTIKLTPSELTMIQEFSGKTIQERLSKEEKLKTERLSEEAQIKRIDNIYGEVYNEVKEKLRKLRSIPKRKP